MARRLLCFRSCSPASSQDTWAFRRGWASFSSRYSEERRDTRHHGSCARCAARQPVARPSAFCHVRSEAHPNGGHLHMFGSIGRTTQHAGYAVSQRKRKRIEECFGCLKRIALMRKVRHRGACKEPKSIGCSPSPAPLTIWCACVTWRLQLGVVSQGRSVSCRAWS
jgi:hypothetical protein